ncbi:MAG: sigma factor-like helix-turn-helix DNA-binding protein [Spirosomataceae bacterium]
MMTKECAVYVDNELLFQHLKSAAEKISNRAFTCLIKCAKSAMKVSRWRIESDPAQEDIDIMQDAAIKLWLDIQKGKYDNPLKRIYHFCHLLKNTYRSLCIDVYRKNKNFTKAELDELENTRMYLPDFLEVIILNEEFGNGSNKLRKRVKQAFDLYMQGHSTYEIAEIMEIGVLSVRNLIAEARRELRGVLDNEEE